MLPGFTIYMKKVRNKKKLSLIGRRELVDFSELKVFGVEAKIDTGAYTTALHCEYIHIHYENSKAFLYFTLGPGQEEPYKFEEFSKKNIKNSFGEMEERFVIKTAVTLGGKKIRSTISLTSRYNMKYPVLIGRKMLKGKFLIDVSLKHTGGIALPDPG